MSELPKKRILTRYRVAQPLIDLSGYPTRTSAAMGGSDWQFGTPPTDEELTYLKEAALRRLLEPQPGVAAEFEPKLVITRKRAIRIGSLPIVFSRRKIETIKLLQEDEPEDPQYRLVARELVLVDALGAGIDSQGSTYTTVPHVLWEGDDLPHGNQWHYAEIERSLLDIHTVGPRLEQRVPLVKLGRFSLGRAWAELHVPEQDLFADQPNVSL